MTQSIGLGEGGIRQEQTPSCSAHAHPDRISNVSLKLIDPMRVEVFPLNPRAQHRFDPSKDADLLSSIRTSGQMVPVIVRASPHRPTFYELVAGARRLSVLRELAKDSAEAKLLAEIRCLTDQDAWVVAEAENAGRASVSALERGKAWSEACARFFHGRQDLLAQELDLAPSVVSRTIALANLPPIFIDLVKNPDAIRVFYAEKLTPLLRDSEKARKLIAHAEALVAQGMRLTPAEALNHLLLSPKDAALNDPRPMGPDSFPRLVVWKKNVDCGATIKLKPLPPGMSIADRRTARKALVKEIDQFMRMFPEPN